VVPTKPAISMCSICPDSDVVRDRYRAGIIRTGHDVGVAAGIYYGRVAADSSRRTAAA